jgi:putative oxidoreductase
MKILALICRILLGLMFVVAGANILHPFLPMPPMPPDAPSTKFFLLFAGSGWMKVVGSFQLIGGLLVLSGGMTPLGLCFLAPVLLNILCFHLLLQGGAGIISGLVATLLEIILIYAYRANFAGIATIKAKAA